MRKRAFGAFFCLLFSFLTTGLKSQEDTRSLADIARKERARKAEQSKKSKVITNDDVASKEADPQSVHKALSAVKVDENGNVSSSEKSPTVDDSTKTPNQITPTAKNLDDANKDSSLLKLSNAEQHGFRIVVGLAAMEDECIDASGSFVSLPQMIHNGCGGSGGSHKYRLKKGYDIDGDPSYSFSVTMAGSGFEVRGDPLGTGLAGFLYDGDEFHYNPTGIASKDDMSLTIRQIKDLLDHGSTKN